MPNPFTHDNLSDGLHHRIDEDVASALFGWILAMTVISAWAIVTTQKRYNRYALLCWAEVATSVTLATVALAYQLSAKARSMAVLTSFVVMWSIEVHIYFQLLFRRLHVLGNQHRWRDMLVVVAILLAVNACTLVVWVPDNVIKSEPIRLALWFWWPRAEKLVYLCLDLTLNVYFVILIKRQLLDIGLTKYHSLVVFTYKCILVSVLCDGALLALQWFPQNPKIFVLAHPFVFLNKLILEIAICTKMMAVSRDRSGELDIVCSGLTPRTIDKFDLKRFSYTRKTPRVAVNVVEMPAVEIDRSHSPPLPQQQQQQQQQQVSKPMNRRTSGVSSLLERRWTADSTRYQHDLESGVPSPTMSRGASSNGTSHDDEITLVPKRASVIIPSVAPLAPVHSQERVHALMTGRI